MDLSRKGVDDSKGLWCPHVTSPQLTSDISSRYSSSDPSATSLADHFYAFYPETFTEALNVCWILTQTQPTSVGLSTREVKPWSIREAIWQTFHLTVLQTDISGRHSVHFRGPRVELVPISHSSSFETNLFFLAFPSLSPPTPGSLPKYKDVYNKVRSLPY